MFTGSLSFHAQFQVLFRTYTIKGQYQLWMLPILIREIEIKEWQNMITKCCNSAKNVIIN